MRSYRFKKLAIITSFLVIFCQNVLAQDLIARQAPIDKTLKIVDSLSIQKLMKLEQATLYSSDLYPNWDNTRVNSYGKNEVYIPATYSIDMIGFCMPTIHTHITSSFGVRRKRMHYGVDIKVYVGDTIAAAFDGKVRIVKMERRGYGKYVVIRHHNGLETIYAHLSKQLVEEDQLVKAGEPIGLGGSTGRSTGSHLHFEVRFLGIALNPEHLFDFQQQDIVVDTYVFTKVKAPEGSSRLANYKATNNTIDSDNNNTDVIRYYKVKSGDTLSQIAVRQGVSLSRLCDLNNTTTKIVIRPGQILRYS